MSLAAFEDQSSQAEGCYYEDPEVGRGIEVLEEPGITVDRVAEALNDVGHGIKLNDPLVLVRNYINVPKDWCKPLEQLKSDIDDLKKIPEEYHDGTGGITKAQYQDKLAENIIKELQPVYIGIIPVDTGNYHQYKCEEHMDEHGCDDLNDRKNTDFKQDLFYKVVVLKK